MEILPIHVDAGLCKINVVMTDRIKENEVGQSSITATTTISVIVFEDENNQPEQLTIDSFGARLVSVSKLGLATVSFERPVVVPDGYSNFTSEYLSTKIKLNVVPGEDQDATNTAISKIGITKFNST